MQPEMKEFAQLLVQHVRDRAVRMSDTNLRTGANSAVAKRWRAAGVQRPEVVIPDVVDATVFALLSAIDQGMLRLQFVSKDGTKIALTEEGLGELSGYYMSSDGWRATYSKERLVDDFAETKDS
jgi:hypothetical protein